MARATNRQAEEFPMYVAGTWRQSSESLAVHSPFSGEIVGTTFLASSEHWETAVKQAVRAFQVTRRMPSFERKAALLKIAEAISRSKEELARLTVLEAGKPLKEARVEVERAVLTFTTAAEEAARIYGEQLPLDFTAGTAGRFGITARFPLGPVLGITPFNFPLNLVAHKLAPAIACGDTIVIKPASKTPLSALRLAALVDQVGLPKGTVSVLPSPSELAELAVADNRLRLLTFTGSAAVGWSLKAKSGKKRVLLELGGNAGVIVDGTADLEYAATRIASGGFSFAGQSCVSVQRTYVESTVGDHVQDLLVHRAKMLKLGDPLDPDVDLGPMIDRGAVERTERWVQEAIAEGATVLTGGKKRANGIFEPTILSGVNPRSKVCVMEVFAPLVDLFRYANVADAISAVNQTPYGLQAGLFSRDLSLALTAFREIEAGAVIVNDVPTWRIDPMPYGGVKDSGMGREGPRYTIDEMTELRLLAIAPPSISKAEPLPASG